MKQLPVMGTWTGAVVALGRSNENNAEGDQT
jgi:hypothetical protein